MHVAVEPLKMEENGMDVVKRQRMDSYPGRPGEATTQSQQHIPDGASASAHGTHLRGALPLGPPNAYRSHPPTSPYQLQPPSSLAEPPPPNANPHYQPSDNDALRNPRSAPPDQSTFARPGTMSNPRSPKSAHAPRPIDTSFDQPPPHYQPQSAADIVDPNVSYAGPDVGPPPNHYAMRGPPHPYDGGPGPPPGMGHPYGDPDMHQGPPPGYYGAPHTAPAWGHFSHQPLRRHNRATQACDTCRQRKVKCDEGKPSCTYCRENGQKCTYKEIQPPKADRIQRELMDKQDIISSDQEIIKSDQEVIKGEIHGLRAEVAELKYLLHGFKDHFPPRGTPVNERGVPIPPVPNSRDAEPSVPPGDSKKFLPQNDEQPLKNTQVEHSIGVHRLLRWSTIQRLLSYPEVLRTLRIKDIKSLNEDFVMQTEQQKGILRVYGRGQGPDRYEGTSGTGSIPSTPTTATAMMAVEDIPSGSSGSPAASPPDIWGRGLGNPNVPNGRFSNGTTDDHPGGLNWDGSLRMDSATMNGLLNSYLDNLHILHPFLSKTRLKRMFDRVREQANPHLRATSSTSSELGKNRSRKRKLSNSGSPMDGATSESVQPGEAFFEQRVSTAIVLMVMALGKICQSDRPLPGPVPELPRECSSTSAPSPYSQSSPNVKASPMRVTSPASSLASLSHAHSSRLHDSSPAERARRDDRNVDVIPGLAYYAKGAEILGTLQGGMGLTHVQAMLLASLYCGQLASSIEAWSWLSQAGRACLFLMKGHAFETEQRRDPVRSELIYFAYWTCYQFEGDILAELDLQPSGIEDLHKQSKNGVKFPQILPEDPGHTESQPDRIMLYYSFQIHLRKTLNDLQHFLYPPDAYTKTMKTERLLSDRYNCLVGLQNWRDILSKVLHWDDDDHISPDMLDARLRAKYYGLMYVIHRPLLEHALHRMPTDISAELKAEMLAYRDGPRARPAATEVALEVSEREVYRACVDCVLAMQRSTTVFDGIIFDKATGEVRKRLIVTNIVGTAHAQFGNMLCYCATYKSHLGFLIDRLQVVQLLERTIRFLRSHKPISFTLGQDAAILEGILMNIDNPLPVISNDMTTSFSSSS